MKKNTRKSVVKQLSIIVALILIGQSIIVFGDINYKDIEDSFAKEAISNVSARGYFNNIDINDSMFYPKKAVTRLEMIVALLNVTKGNEKYYELTLPFVDIDSLESIYKPYIISSYRDDILSGKLIDGKMYSLWDKEITREEAFTMIGKWLQRTSVDEIKFSDKKEISDWAKEYIYWLVKYGVIYGSENNTLRPKDYITREELAVVLDRILSLNLVQTHVTSIYGGNAKLGFVNGPRLSASFVTPKGIAVAKNGDLLIADTDGNQIRSIDGTKVMLLAGKVVGLSPSGLPLSGYQDGVVAEEAVLNGPRYMAVNSLGDIYFTEYNTNMIRVIQQSDNKLFTFSGSFESGYKNGSADQSLYNNPGGLAIDQEDNVYIADTLNNCIRIIDAKGQSQLYAGIADENGGYEDGSLLEASFNQPTDIAFGSDGVLYVCDSGNSVIRKIEDGKVTTLAGMLTETDEETFTKEGGFKDGKAEEAMFRFPKGIAVADNGAVYIADTGNNLVRKIYNGYVSTIAGLPSAMSSAKELLNQPFGVAVRGNSVFVTDSLNHCVKVIVER